jgi:hypothetical protein
MLKTWIPLSIQPFQTQLKQFFTLINNRKTNIIFYLYIKTIYYTARNRDLGIKKWLYKYKVYGFWIQTQN